MPAVGDNHQRSRGAEQSRRSRCVPQPQVMPSSRSGDEAGAMVGDEAGRERKSAGHSGAAGEAAGLSALQTSEPQPQPEPWLEAMPKVRNAVRESSKRSRGAKQSKRCRCQSCRRDGSGSACRQREQAKLWSLADEALSRRRTAASRSRGRGRS